MRTSLTGLSGKQLFTVADAVYVPASLFGRIRPMPRAFAYLRVSTPGQTTDNQLREIQRASGWADRRA